MAITTGDILFVDTNVLLTATNESRPSCSSAKQLIRNAGANGVHLAVSGQILREYLVVATRPKDVNGFGLSPSQAIGNVNQFLQHMVVYEETEVVTQCLRELIRSYDLKGKRIHDANVAATMLVHGISKIVTENADDFSSFAELEISSIVGAADTVLPPPA